MEFPVTLDKFEVFEYLDRLNASNMIPMFKAGSHLRDWFGCEAAEAKYWLLEWIEEYQSGDEPD